MPFLIEEEEEGDDGDGDGDEDDGDDGDEDDIGEDDGCSKTILLIINSSIPNINIIIARNKLKVLIINKPQSLSNFLFDFLGKNISSTWSVAKWVIWGT